MKWKNIWYFIRVETENPIQLTLAESRITRKKFQTELENFDIQLDWDRTDTLHVSARDGGWYVGMIKENAVDCYVLRCVQCSVQCTDCTALCTQPVCSSEELSQQRSLVTTWSVLKCQCQSVFLSSLSWCDVSLAIISSNWRTV